MAIIKRIGIIDSDRSKKPVSWILFCRIKGSIFFQDMQKMKLCCDVLVKMFFADICTIQSKSTILWDLCTMCGSFFLAIAILANFAYFRDNSRSFII